MMRTQLCEYCKSSPHAAVGGALLSLRDARQDNHLTLEPLITYVTIHVADKSVGRLREG